MNPAYWYSLQNTTAWAVFNAIDNLLLFAMLAAFFNAWTAVKGSRRRYLASTWIRGLGVPLIAAELFRAIVNIAAHDYINAIPSVVNALIYVWWIRRYGDDDYWSDLKKKLKRKLKSLSSRRRAALAGTSA